MTNEIIPVNDTEVVPQVNLNFEEVCKFVDPNKLGTQQELRFFFELCKMRGMNPLIKEVYWIKYNKNAAAQNVIAVDTFVARAGDHQDYQGYASGWYIQIDPKDPTSVDATEMPFGKCLGAWCSVYRVNQKPLLYRVRFDAYSTGKNRWASDPFGMIEKCAIAGAHRKAYPKSFAQFYTEEELDSGNIKVINPNKGEQNGTEEKQLDRGGQSSEGSSIEGEKSKAPRPNFSRNKTQRRTSQKAKPELQSAADSKRGEKDQGQRTESPAA